MSDEGKIEEVDYTYARVTLTRGKVPRSEFSVRGFCKTGKEDELIERIIYVTKKLITKISTSKIGTDDSEDYFD